MPLVEQGARAGSGPELDVSPPGGGVWESIPKIKTSNPNTCSFTVLRLVPRESVTQRLLGPTHHPEINRYPLLGLGLERGGPVGPGSGGGPQPTPAPWQIPPPHPCKPWCSRGAPLPSCRSRRTGTPGG